MKLIKTESYYNFPCEGVTIRKEVYKGDDFIYRITKLKKGGSKKIIKEVINENIEEFVEKMYEGVI